MMERWEPVVNCDKDHMQATLLCGKYSTTMQMRIVSRFWFCRRPRRLKIDVREKLVHFRKSHVRAHKFDVQETNICFTQFYGSLINFSRWFTHGTVSRSRSLEFGYRSVPFFQNQHNNTKCLDVQGNLSLSTTSNKHMPNQTKVPTQHDNLNLYNVDCVLSNVKFSRSSAMLYAFEDNEAVIKMVIKGRSPTMRHVSRTHRVALDWLFERINLDPKIQIRYIDTKHKLPGTLTKGNFTRDEWNSLLYLLNISHFSSLCCAQNFMLSSCTKTMAKRMREQEKKYQEHLNYLEDSVSTRKIFA